METFNSNPNQKKIAILEKGKAICDENNLYLKAQKKAMFAAMKNLTPTNFEVWIYLASHAPKYEFWFSPAAISKETGLKKSALQEGIRVLIQEGYLIQRKNCNNVYDFYEVPIQDQEPKEQEIKIQVHKNSTDSFIF